jgi:hypothetical protein
MKNAEVEREHREHERDEADPEPDVDREHVTEKYMRARSAAVGQFG